MDSVLKRSNKQQQWQELLTRVQDLAKATSDENAQLISKVKELEVEVSVWKQALSASRGPQDKPSVTFRKTNSVENGEVNGKDHKNIALCVIDGTRNIFSTSYITQSEQGGRKAGQEIVQGITENLADDSSLQGSDTNISISLFVGKARLRNDLVAGSFCSPEQFDDFFVGLNETQYLNVVEVAGKKEADAKIKGKLEHLQLYAGLPQIVRVYFSGGNGSEYVSIMPALEAASAANKLVLLRSQSSPSISTYARIPSLILAGLFMKNLPSGQLVPTTPLTATSSSPFPVSEVDDWGSYTPSPKPWSDVSITTKQHVIDPSLPLYKQNPPPCNEHYLMEVCSKEGRCKYSHEYELTEEQLETLSRNAKQSPCWFLNNDRECPYGSACCWGHVCPFGIKCAFSLRDKCRFKGWLPVMRYTTARFDEDLLAPLCIGYDI
ncbi:hypothetical protein BC834DRAFT_843772 [Gloeopeniophorella convolvens]|nr:hypothetical protein BC834DRAFT_843772 [Gloeopeniophorella convolvens]